MRGRVKSSGILLLIALLLITPAFQNITTTKASNETKIWTTDENNNLQNDFPPNSIVYIHGTGFLNTHIVNIQITRPDDHQSNYSTMTDAQGNFVFEYDLNGIDGKYVVNTTDGANSALTIFYDQVGNPDTECSNNGFDFGIAKYESGETTPDETGSGYSTYTITINWVQNGDGEYISALWTSTPSVCGVISKEGPNTYTHSGGTSGTITSTEGKEISHITFCGCNQPPPEPTTLTLNPDSATNELPGDQTHEFTATVTDQNGNPMQNIMVSFHTDFGNFTETNSNYTEKLTDSNGEAKVTIVSSTAGTAHIKAWVDDDEDDAWAEWEITDSPSSKTWNPPKGTIIIQKDADPNDSQNFQFTGDLGTFSLDDDSNPTLSNQKTFSDITPGTYDITEITPTGWYLTSIDITDLTSDSTITASTATVNVASGETITVKFTNVKTYPITIVKNTVPDSGKDFEFIGDLGSFSLDDDADPTLPNSRTFWMPPGTYVVDEKEPSPYYYPKITIQNDDDGGSTYKYDDPYATATIDLDAGEDITVVFKNTKPSQIVIIKDAIPNHPQNFKFRTYTEWTGDLLLSGYLQPDTVLDDDSDNTLSNASYINTNFGKYRVVEGTPGTGSIWNVGPPSGWSLINIDINDPDGDSYVDDDIAYVDLDPGEKVTVKFTNKQDEIPDSLQLTPDSATNVLPGDTSHIFTATVIDQFGSPMQNINVSFHTDFGNFSDTNTNYTEKKTDSNGEAKVTVVSSSPGIAHIRAWLDNGDDIYASGEISDTPSVKTWDSPTNLSIYKTANTEWHRAYNWSITKKVDPDYLILNKTETGNVTYTIDVKRELVKEVYSVNGTISAENIGDNIARIKKVEDVIEQKVPGSSIWTQLTRETIANKDYISVGDTAEWDYEISFTPVPGVNYRNLAYVTLENHFASSGGIEEKTYVYIESINIPTSPTTEEDASATITDVQAIPTGFSAVDNYPSGGWNTNSDDTFSINKSITNNNAESGTYYVNNTATLTEDDTKEKRNASASVEIKIPRVTLTLDPKTSVNVLPHSLHNITATVLKDGQPQAGILVSFKTDFGTFIGAPGDGTYIEVPTNANGQATVTITSTTPGTATIQSWVDEGDPGDSIYNEGELTDDPATKTWQQPGISVEKHVWNTDTSMWTNDIQVPRGTNLTFRILIHNTGSAVLTNIHVNDTLSKQLAYRNTANHTPTASTTNHVFWTFQSLNPQETIEITFHAEAITLCQGWNKVNVSTNQTDPTEDKVMVKVKQPERPDILIQKKIWNESSQTWEDTITTNISTNITFQLIVKNTGNVDLTNIEVTDTLPNFLTYNNDANPRPYQSSSHYIKWKYSTLPKYQSKTMTFTAHVHNTGENDNVAKVSAHYEENTLNKQDKAHILIKEPPQPSINITKHVKHCETWSTSTSLIVEDNAEFRIIVTNTGDLTLHNINITDTLPTFLTYHIGSSTPTPTTINGQQIIWKISTLEPGHTFEILFTAIAMDEGEGDNIATVTAETPEMGPLSDTAHLIIASEYVDTEPPVTTKEYGNPYQFIGGLERVTTQTPIWLNATDQPRCHASGVNHTYYRILSREYDGTWSIEADWTLYTGPFTMPHTCHHKIEFYSIDNAGNQEDIQSQEVKVSSYL